MHCNGHEEWISGMGSSLRNLETNSRFRILEWPRIRLIEPCDAIDLWRWRYLQFFTFSLEVNWSSCTSSPVTVNVQKECFHDTFTIYPKDDLFQFPIFFAKLIFCLILCRLYWFYECHVSQFTGEWTKMWQCRTRVEVRLQKKINKYAWYFNCSFKCWRL